MNHTRVIATDHAKHVFQVSVIDRHEKELLNKSMRRKTLAAWLARQRPAVGVKSLDQQSVQSDKRVQEHLSDQLTATGNLLRALVAEFGVLIPKGIAALRRELPLILEDAGNGLPLAMREGLYLAWQQWLYLADCLRCAEQIVKARSDALRPCQNLTAFEGVGPKNALGLYIRLGNGQHFRNGREAAACVGVTPRQSSSGGKTHLKGIGKYRGDQRLRSSLIVGARAVVNAVQKRPARNAREQWLKALIERRGAGRAAVALANKNVRTAWAMLHDNTTYQEQAIAN